MKLTNARCYAISSRMDYVIDRDRFVHLLEKAGYSSLSSFCQAAGVHRNTLAAYLDGEKGVFSDFVDRLAGFLNVSQLTIIRPKDYPSELSDEYKHIVNILTDFYEGDKDLAFCLIGSRAKGRAQQYSDWDIGVTSGVVPLDSLLYLKLKDRLDDAVDDFARSVDFVNLDCAPLWFLSGLNYSPKFICGNPSSFAFFEGTLNGIQKAA